MSDFWVKFHDTCQELVIALEEREKALDSRELVIEARERQIKSFLGELASFHDDLRVDVPSSAYTPIEPEEVEGIQWITETQLAAREYQVVRALQLYAEELSAAKVPRMARDLVAVGDNSELLQRCPSLKSLNTSAFSACLTRLKHKRVVFMRQYNQERQVVLLSRLRDLGE
jgi:hypothetical protein